MKRKHGEIGNGKNSQDHGSIHVAFAWLAALSVSIAAWALT